MTGADRNVSPDRRVIRLRRKAYDLTQAEAGALVYSARRTWQDWEAGNRHMHPAIWELFEIKLKELL